MGKYEYLLKDYCDLVLPYDFQFIICEVKQLFRENVRTKNDEFSYLMDEETYFEKLGLLTLLVKIQDQRILKMISKIFYSIYHYKASFNANTARRYATYHDYWKKHRYGKAQPYSFSINVAAILFLKLDGPTLPSRENQKIWSAVKTVLGINALNNSEVFEKFAYGIMEKKFKYLTIPTYSDEFLEYLNIKNDRGSDEERDIELPVDSLFILDNIREIEDKKLVDSLIEGGRDLFVLHFFHSESSYVVTDVTGKLSMEQFFKCILHFKKIWSEGEAILLQLQHDRSYKIALNLSETLERYTCLSVNEVAWTRRGNNG